MSALLQLPSYMEQPSVPLSPPPTQHHWGQNLPSVLKKVPRRIEYLEDGYLQDLSQEIPTGCATGALNDVFVIENGPIVTQFVEDYRLLSLLLEAREPLNDAFGESAVKMLSLTTDDEGFETLYCLVVVPGEMEGARRALRTFDHTWWLAHSHKAAGRLNFDFELI